MLRLNSLLANEIAKGLPCYEDFLNLTNRKTTYDFVEEIFTILPGKGYGSLITQEDLDFLIRKITQAMPIEYRKIHINKERMHENYRLAQGGELSNDLLEQAGIDRTTILKRLPSVQYTHLEGAAQWVLDASNTFKREDGKQRPPGTRRVANKKEQSFIDSMWSVVSRNQYMTSVGTLELLHKSCGHVNGKGKRSPIGPSKFQFYGGVSMGIYLQTEVALLAETLRPFANRYPKFWYDIAGFMLIGYIIAHGFSDGNGRAARSLYCSTLVKHRMPFIEPDNEWVKKHVISLYPEEYGHPAPPVYNHD